MPKYTFTFKKDDVFVEFYTADKDVVERQFQIWVSNADDYVNNRPYKSSYDYSANSEITKDIQNIEPETEQISNIPEQNVVIEPERIEPSIEIPQFGQPYEQQQQDLQTEEPEVFDKASTLLRTINSIQEPENLNTEENLQPSVDFEQVLEENIENPTFEPNRPRDQVFLNLVMSKKTTDKFNYLMITAYYLSEFEKLERFSLKQINSKLMQNLSEVIDHALLQSAIDQDFVELVPDLTGISEVAEYRLTRIGEEFFAKI